MKTITCLLLLLLSATVNGQFILTDYFHPTGPSESLVAKFDHSVEGYSASKYRGLIWLRISNFGWDNLNEAHDAFYYFINAGQNNWIPQKSVKGLNIAFAGNSVRQGDQYFHISNDISVLEGKLFQIAFNETIGLYSGANNYGIPEYNPGHTYDIVLNINSPSDRILNFGFTEGGWADNSGQWDITITPVAVGATPEPTAGMLIVLTITLGSLLARRRDNPR